ncbi:hypothetical protein H0H93_014865 [Arthromyces matolae]|nr:hypothetical protein H0H93_014865 [Arthromyces matolae]
MSVPPRAYDASDLMSLKRNDLINLVKSQQDRWPVEIRLNSHVNKTQIRNVLLDPQYGFTTTNPPVEQFDAWDLASNPFATLLAQPQAQGSLVLPLPPPAPPRPLDDTEFDLVLPEDGRPVSRVSERNGTLPIASDVFNRTFTFSLKTADRE